MAGFFNLKRGDLFPPIEAQAVDDRGYPRDLTGASAVRFTMRAAGQATLKVDADASIADAENGVLSYAWSGTDTDTAGLYVAEFEFVLGGKQTLPSKGTMWVCIEADLNGT